MILTIVIVLVVVGVLLWLVTTYVPMHPAVKQILVVVVLVALVIWILGRSGLLARAGIHLPWR